jgi:hypothetical protein
MGRRVRHRLLAPCLPFVVFAVVVALAAPADAAATRTTALWNMNEAAGATTMVDSSGNGRNGTVGSDVQTGVSVLGAVGYRFPFILPNQPPARPQHLVTVPDNPLLDPDTADYAVTVRYRTTRNFGNVLQKGQNGAAGGYWKFEQPNGFITCLFRNGSGVQRAVQSPRALNDGAWHTVRCERTATALTLTVDGAVVRRAALATPLGSIANSRPLSIGGKLNCDQDTITCDYFVGDIDYVRIQKG